MKKDKRSNKETTNEMNNATRTTGKRNKRNNRYEDRPYSFNDMVEARKQEMARDILPGFYSVVRDPVTGREVKCYSTSVNHRSMFKIMEIDEK